MKTKNNLLLATTALVTLTALTFSGCSENEVTDINPDANPAMSFDVYTGVQTKGTETTTSSIQAATSDGFGVLAYKTTGEWDGEGTADAATPNIMYNEHVYYNSAAWKYDNTKFWPTNEDKISFFAYAPYESAPAEGTDKKIKLSAASETGAPTIEFEVNATELTKMVDLVTDTQKNKTSSDNTGKVSFELKHVLTKVVLKAKTDVALGDVTKVFITGVKVAPKESKLCSKATYKFADDTWDYTESTPTYFENDINLYDETNGVLNLTTASSWGYTTNSVDVSGTSEVDLFKSDEALYFIPARNTDGLEAAGDVQLKVSYDIVTKVSDEANTTSSVSEKVIDLPQYALQKGNSYTYTLIIGMNAIQLEGTVDTNWTDATSSPGSGDIDVK